MTRLSPLAAAFVVGLVLAGFATFPAGAANEDEAKVPPYTFPELLRMSDGRALTNAVQWPARRRELLATLEKEIYGRFPAPPPGDLPPSRWQVLAEDPDALGGRALRRDVALLVRTRGVVVPTPDTPILRFTVFQPRTASRPIRTFVGLHLFDTARPAPRLAATAPGGDPDRASAAIVDELLGRGYAIASLDLPDLAPDSATNWWRGAYLQLAPELNRERVSAPPTRVEPGPEETGALGLWAWGLCRALDYFSASPGFDPHGVVVIGHSRMGKAALWAAANDARFAAAISNDSGCGGAALNRRIFGETVAIITRAFPHWFCGNFRTYADHEDRLPVDAHQLLASIAPRPLYVASAEEDRWADPRGEYLATYHAAAAWRLLGQSTPGLLSSNLPSVNQPVGDLVRYHVRSGRHDLTDVDWRHYLDFAEQVLE